ncbi:MAG: 16S rRNA (adenine(1518)-N(6)/adenine(1519)-N(6))-dimethyltransferase RsmA [Candidatus Heimdallarchaeota archaeon]|nr:16S rRNA (adenine(1518)-N(6)/adenine(1519)-N(6))-dimethyltransferase RsmA [Candidatus Heimdallarchaeota archaeon]MDH5646968.1 16S rRNA (adenine(1518)-N(6)/adenine(1519)-N(6))-dimethyltransferase RsmA [Candidatus Heimdallarchaeota archaeon]
MRDWRNYTLQKLEELNKRAIKSEGQNFCIRYRTINQIVKQADISPAEYVLEIGGGLGILTHALSLTGARIDVYETDQILFNHLEEEFKSLDTVTIFAEDALNANWPENIRLVSNLPYQHSSKFIIKFLHHQATDAYFMLQKEFAIRCIASPGTKEYGRLSILCQLHSKVIKILDVPSDAFFPKPKVHSSVLHFTRQELETQNDHKDIELLTNNLFTLKRRVLRSVLRGFLKRKNVSEECWEKVPYHDKRINELTAIDLDEILSFLKQNQCWPLA